MQASPQVGSAAALVMTGLPLGSLLSDGRHSFTVTEQASVANLKGWNIARLRQVPPLGCTGTLVLQVRSIGHAPSNNAVPPGANPSNNPFVSFTAATSASTPTTSSTSPQIVVGPMALESGLLTFTAAPAPRTAQDEEDANQAGSSVLSDALLQELEQFAKASWLGGMG